MRQGEQLPWHGVVWRCCFRSIWRGGGDGGWQQEQQQRHGLGDCSNGGRYGRHEHVSCRTARMFSVRLVSGGQVNGCGNWLGGDGTLM